MAALENLSLSLSLSTAVGRSVLAEQGAAFRPMEAHSEKHIYTHAGEHAAQRSGRQVNSRAGRHVNAPWKHWDTHDGVLGDKQMRTLWQHGETMKAHVGRQVNAHTDKHADGDLAALGHT